MKRRLPNTTIYLDTADFVQVSSPIETSLQVDDTRFVITADRQGTGDFSQTLKGSYTFEKDLLCKEKIYLNKKTNHNIYLNKTYDETIHGSTSQPQNYYKKYTSTVEVVNSNKAGTKDITTGIDISSDILDYLVSGYADKINQSIILYTKNSTASTYTSYIKLEPSTCTISPKDIFIYNSNDRQVKISHEPGINVSQDKVSMSLISCYNPSSSSQYKESRIDINCTQLSSDITIATDNIILNKNKAVFLDTDQCYYTQYDQLFVSTVDNKIEHSLDNTKTESETQYFSEYTSSLTISSGNDTTHPDIRNLPMLKISKEYKNTINKDSQDTWVNNVEKNKSDIFLGFLGKTRNGDDYRSGIEITSDKNQSESTETITLKAANNITLKSNFIYPGTRNTALGDNNNVFSSLFVESIYSTSLQVKEINYSAFPDIYSSLDIYGNITTYTRHEESDDDYGAIDFPVGSILFLAFLFPHQNANTGNYEVRGNGGNESIGTDLYMYLHGTDITIQKNARYASNNGELIYRLGFALAERDLGNWDTPRGKKVLWVDEDENPYLPLKLSAGEETTLPRGDYRFISVPYKFIITGGYFYYGSNSQPQNKYRFDASDKVNCFIGLVQRVY